MYIFDIENKASLYDVLLENLKTLGVKCRLPKKIKENEKENVYPDNQIFQKPLHLLKKCCTCRLSGHTIQVPEFLVDACVVIEKDIKTEGIFRKAGSTCKQRERKLELNRGEKVSCDYHVLDACGLVKLFFRELPHPIIPYAYHDIFLKCLLLSTYEKELEALMLACLLIPEENLATLAFFMEFLLKVSWHADRNKMNVKNLAIILTPTLMPVSKGTRPSNNLEMAHHFKVIEMLIENAERIGEVPDKILETLTLIGNKKSKKKRRSGSITRMFTGLRKMVGRSSAVSECDDSIISTPDSLSSLRKRKNTDPGCQVTLSAKKKRLSDSTPPAALTPSRCRMHGYASSFLSLPSPIPSNVKRIHARSPGYRLQPKSIGDEPTGERDRSNSRPSRLNLVRRCTTKKQKSQVKLFSTGSMETLIGFETEKNPIERRLSLISWGHRKLSQSSLSAPKPETEPLQENATDHSDNEFITVPKSDYEEIKNRVSALEEDLEKLRAVHTVQTAYEKTLEESEKLNDGTADQLAKRLSRELKIRRSSENQIIRSPSARKIGSIRRRSRESGQKNSEPRSNLKRGRPNTLQTGLPSPRLRTFSNESVPSAKKNPIAVTFPEEEQKEEWKSGETFFAKDHVLQRLTPAPLGRPSIAEIRCQNAGMVLEKAKLFNSLNESDGSKVMRRRSVRLENMRRMNDAVKCAKSLSRTKSLVEKKQKSSPVLENGIGQDFKSVTFNVCTPKSQKQYGSRRETPSIKKALVTRSPRSLAKTPLSQMKSVQRNRATPMKALIEANGTPHIGLRRSPRVLARAINTPCRLRE